MNKVEIKEAVEAIQWQAQGMMKVLEELLKWNLSVQEILIKI